MIYYDILMIYKEREKGYVLHVAKQDVICL